MRDELLLKVHSSAIQRKIYARRIVKRISRYSERIFYLCKSLRSTFEIF